MDILAIESSCDETAAAVIRDGREIISSVVATQIEEHKLYGGVVPEIASRRHCESIVGVVNEALEKAGKTAAEIDAIAVTYAPGLIGALLVGVNFAKGLAFSLDKPLIPVHHIRGHIAANYLVHPELEPPYMCLVASGGHSHIVKVNSYTDFETVGRTVDDAAGEVFDKVARAIGLGYPGGPKIDKVSREGNADAITFPKAKVNGAEYDFSFSGLKSCVLNYLNTAKMAGEEVPQADLAASFQKAVVDVLCDHMLHACHETGFRRAALAGGVASNSTLRAEMERRCAAEGVSLFVPPPILCTDNAAMIGAAAYYEFKAGHISGWDLNADPRLGLGQR